MVAEFSPFEPKLHRDSAAGALCTILNRYGGNPRQPAVVVVVKHRNGDTDAPRIGSTPASPAEIRRRDER
jgi:hypothetical protein